MGDHSPEGAEIWAAKAGPSEVRYNNICHQAKKGSLLFCWRAEQTNFSKCFCHDGLGVGGLGWVRWVDPKLHDWGRGSFVKAVSAITANDRGGLNKQLYSERACISSRRLFLDRETTRFSHHKYGSKLHIWNTPECDLLHESTEEMYQVWECRRYFRQGL